jgi:hypothetical protein
MTERMADTQLDREIRTFLAWQADDLAGAPSAREMAARVGEHAGARGVPVFGRSQQRLAQVLLVAALLALLIGTAAFVGGSRLTLSTSVQNGWIALSSQPGYRQTFGTDWAAGGDIYFVREGVAPRIIVERGPDMKRNVCPQFSPDGWRLVYGELSGDAAALVVLDVSDDGTVAESRRLVVPGASSVAPCPRWSRNGTHLAYLDGVHWDTDGNLDSTGTGVLVFDLNGTAADWTAADPSVDDLRRSGTFDPLEAADGFDPLRSPDGDLRATCGDDGIVVGPPDGSANRLVPTRLCGYSMAGWSPDGTKIVLLSDGGRHATMSIVTVMGPLKEEHIAPSIPVNGLRSWPGRGDVSWQPVYP